MNFTQIIIKSLILIHKGIWLTKFKSVLLLSLIVSPMYLLGNEIANWLNLNIAFISFVFGAVLIDHAIGSYVHAYIKKDFSMKENVKGLFLKLGLIVAVFFIGRGIVNILGETNVLALYVRTLMRLMVFLYPAGSALFNCAIITKGKFPPIGFLNKIKKFNQNLDVEEFKEKNG